TFTTVTAGITRIADAILGGSYNTNDPVIRRYRLRLRNKTQDAMPLEEMTNLVKAILRETKRSTPFVGGEDQIAVLPIHNDAQFMLPLLPRDKEMSARFELWHGFQCVRSDCKSDRTTSFDDLQRLIEPMGKLFLAGTFTHSSVSLDHNYFVRD